jgi:hypothetical protein
MRACVACASLLLERRHMPRVHRARPPITVSDSTEPAAVGAYAGLMSARIIAVPSLTTMTSIKKSAEREAHRTAASAGGNFGPVSPHFKRAPRARACRGGTS